MIFILKNFKLFIEYVLYDRKDFKKYIKKNSKNVSIVLMDDMNLGTTFKDYVFFRNIIDDYRIR